MSNEDKPQNWIEQIGEKVAANDDVDKQHGRTLGKLESAATSRQQEITETELDEDKYKGIDDEGRDKIDNNTRDSKSKFDKDTYYQKQEEAEIAKEKRAVKDYDNRMTKPTLPEPEPEKASKNILGKVDDLIDKATPYADDLAKGFSTFGKVLGVTAGIVGFFDPEPVGDATLYGEFPEWEAKDHVPIDLTIENSTSRDALIENESPPIDVPIHSVSNDELIDLTDVPEVQNLFNQLDEIGVEQDIPNSIESLDLEITDYEDMGDGMDMDFD